MTEPCVFLPWDSSFFGFRIAKVTRSKIDPASARAINAWCQEQNIRCLYFLASADDPETAVTAEAENYRLADIRLTMEQQLSAPRTAKPLPENLSIRTAARGDLAALQTLAGSAFGLSRFYFDPGFPRQRCGELYRTWIEKSCSASNQLVLTAEEKGRLVGFISAEWDPANIESGKIGLLGVEPGGRGRGIGQHLMDRCLERLTAAGMRQIDAVTQARNIGAQRVNQRAGFITRSIDLWYHKWI